MYILFDIGGAKMRLAGSRDSRTFSDPVKIPTPGRDFEEGIRAFADASRRIAAGEPIEAVAGGIRGPFDRVAGALTNDPSMPGWNGKPLIQALERSHGCRVYLENDTAIVGLGEAHAGAGKGVEIMAYVTVSTGVNGVRIVNGRIDANRFGFEIGHHIVNADAVVQCDACSRSRGEVENYISGTAFRRVYGKEPYEVTDPAAWDNAARILGIALNNVSVCWAQVVMVIGGSMVTGTNGAVIPFERIEHHFEGTLTIFPQRPKLRKAELGDVGGLHGALAFLRQQLAYPS